MGVREVSAEGVGLEYVSAAGVRERGSLGRLWSVPFESIRPERRFPAFRWSGQLVRLVLVAMEFARFLGLPVIGPRHNTIDVTSAVCQVLIEARTDLVLVDEIHLLNHATIAGEDLSDHLKYFTEHLPATFVCAGINVEQSGLFTGIRGKQLAGRCVLIRTGPFPLNAEWRSLIASMENTIRLHRHEPNTLAKMAQHLHQRTGGMIGSLSHLVRAAAISAILDGTERKERPVTLSSQLRAVSSAGRP